MQLQHVPQRTEALSEDAAGMLGQLCRWLHMIETQLGSASSFLGPTSVVIPIAYRPLRIPELARFECIDSW